MNYDFFRVKWIVNNPHTHAHPTVSHEEDDFTNLYEAENWCKILERDEQVTKIDLIGYSGHTLRHVEKKVKVY